MRQKRKKKKNVIRIEEDKDIQFKRMRSKISLSYVRMILFCFHYFYILHRRKWDCAWYIQQQKMPKHLLILVSGQRTTKCVFGFHNDDDVESAEKQIHSIFFSRGRNVKPIICAHWYKYQKNISQHKHTLSYWHHIWFSFFLLLLLLRFSFSVYSHTHSCRFLIVIQRMPKKK